MTNRFMISVAAAALIAGTGLANAQGVGREGGSPSPASPAQQSAPAAEHGNSAAPSNREAVEPKGPSSGMKAMQSEQKEPGAAKNQRAEDNAQGPKSKNLSSENDKTNGATRDRSAVDGKSQTTVGQAGAGAKLSTEQRTRITTVIRNEHVAPVTNVNFSISVGTRVPRDVSFRPLPAEVVTIYPQWRGYEFILVRDQILVIDPQTYEIVAIIEA